MVFIAFLIQTSWKLLNWSSRVRLGVIFERIIRASQILWSYGGSFASMDLFLKLLD